MCPLRGEIYDEQIHFTTERWVKYERQWQRRKEEWTRAAAASSKTHLQMTLHSFIIALWVNSSFCWLEWGWVAELLSETTALATKKAATVLRGGRNGSDGNIRREMKQTETGTEEMKIFFLRTSFCILHSGAMYFSEVRWEPYVQLLGTQQLTRLQQKQYPGYISSRQHLTDIKKLPGTARLRSAEREGRGRWKCARLIVTVMKAFVKTATWWETNTKWNYTSTALWEKINLCNSKWI